MQTLASMLLFVVCAVAADQPAEPVTSTITHDPGGAATVIVHNGASVTLTAFNFIYTLHRDPNGPAYGASMGYYDALTDPQLAQPVPPGQEITLPFRIGGNGMYAKVAVAASVFADGTSYGEKATVQKILDRRNYMLVSLNKSIGELTQAAKAGERRELIVQQFQMALGQEMAAGLDQELNACIQTVRGLVIGTLRSARAADGSVIPTDTQVQSLIETLKARRELLNK
ncbi:MAG: hypothetical protein P4L56_07370 [Candidatus Sulfopaludibacter sp.]|nr:hypothetical protein [Candidatus Sulfopaludibacter sp.]